METAEKIKKLRKKMGLSQKELAERAGLSIASIQGYEQGKYKPKMNATQKLAVALEVSFAELIGSDELKERYKILQRELHLVHEKKDWPPAEKERIIGHIEGEISTVQAEIHYNEFLINEARKEDYKENQLICEYRKLNEIGKKEASKRMEELTKIPEYRQEPDNSHTPK